MTQGDDCGEDSKNEQYTEAKHHFLAVTDHLYSPIQSWKRVESNTHSPAQIRSRLLRRNSGYLQTISRW
jgi:hypothetical protein